MESAQTVSLQFDALRYTRSILYSLFFISRTFYEHFGFLSKQEFSWICKSGPCFEFSADFQHNFKKFVDSNINNLLYLAIYFKTFQHNYNLLKYVNTCSFNTLNNKTTVFELIVYQKTGKDETWEAFRICNGVQARKAQADTWYRPFRLQRKSARACTCTRTRFARARFHATDTAVNVGVAQKRKGGSSLLSLKVSWARQYCHCSSCSLYRPCRPCSSQGYIVCQ